MATAELHERTELDRIESWRRERLRAAGFSAEAAEELAGRHEVDLHDAVELIERGCPPEVAVRILV